MKPHAERHINESRLSVKYRIPPMSAGRILFPGSIPSYTNSRQSTPPLFLFPPFFKGRGFPSSSRFSSSSLFTASSFPTWEMKRSNRLVLRIANSVCGTAPFVRILIRPVHPHQHIPDKAELLQRNRLRNHFRFR